MTRYRLARLVWAAALLMWPARLPAAPPPLRAVLPGGLRVVLSPERATSMIGVALLIETGPEPEPGADLLLSRLLWPASADRAEADLVSRAASGWMPGRLLLEGSALPEDAPRLLARFAGALLRPEFPARSVEAARQASLDDLARRDLDPYRLGSDTLRQALYPDSPLGRPNLEGARERLQALTPGALADYARRRFVARRAVLALTGDFDPARALAWIRSAFSALPSGPPAPPPLRALPWPRPARPRFLLVQGAWSAAAMPYSYILAGFRAPDRTASEVAARQVLMALLTGPDGKLRRLTGRPGIALDPRGQISSGATVPQWAADSPVLIYLLIQPYILDERTGEARLAFQEIRHAFTGALAEVARGRFSAGEVARARRFTLGAWAQRTLRMREQAAWLAYGESCGPGPAEIARVPAAIEALTPAALKAYARRCLAAPQVALVCPAPG